jgi:hypothetical protein
MKKVSKLQFQNAVQRVLNGGSSKIVTTKQEKPFKWTRSNGRMKLLGTIPDNSKFLRNDAKGGKESDVYLVCYLATNYEICLTKKEQEKIELIEKQRARIRNAKAAEKRLEMYNFAKSNGFSSVAQMKAAQKEIDDFNRSRLSRALFKQNEKFKELHGRVCDVNVLKDRVLLSMITLEYDCESKRDLIK